MKRSLKGLKMHHEHGNTKSLYFFIHINSWYYIYIIYLHNTPPSPLTTSAMTCLHFPLSYKPIGNHVLLQFLLHLGKPLSQTKPLNSELLPTYTFRACNICCAVASRKLTMLCFKLLEQEASV